MFGFNAHKNPPPAERIADILLRTETAHDELRSSCAKAPFFNGKKRYGVLTLHRPLKFDNSMGQPVDFNGGRCPHHLVHTEMLLSWGGER